MYFRTILVLIGCLVLNFSAVMVNGSCYGAEIPGSPMQGPVSLAGNDSDFPEDQAIVAANGSGDILFQGNSEYSSIRILEKGNMRCLVFGSDGESTQTCMNMARPDEPVFEYTAMMFLGFLFQPASKKSCLIGVGGGYIPTVFRMHLPAHQLHMVELDPLVCKLAEKYLGFRTTSNQKLVIEDGRKYLERTKEVFDQILLDAFDSDYVPAHMNTRDFLEICKSRLSPNGIVVQNAHSNHFRYPAQVAIYRQAFAYVYLFHARRSANTVIVAADRPLCRPPDFCGFKERSRIGRIDLAAEAKKNSQYSGDLTPLSDHPSTIYR